MTCSRPIFLLAALLILTLAAAPRLPALTARPFHGDEAVNAVKFKGLWERNDYKYDPREFHGPALPYASLPVVAATARNYPQTTEASYRLVTALFGIGLVALTLCAAHGIGYPAAIIASLLTAISTAFVFYSRYYIHEMLLVTFTWCAILSGWRYSVRPSITWAIACGASLALMHATKETALLAWAAMIAGIVTIRAATVRERARMLVLERGPFPHGRGSRRVVAFGYGLLAFIAVYTLLFSSFFTNWPGVFDGVRTFFLYADRGAGQAEPLHVHLWDWYLAHLLFYQAAPRAPWYSEAMIYILALVGIAAAWTQRDMILPRFLSVYGIVLAVIYCLIPYKTPWCVLSFWHAFVVLGGMGAASLLRWSPLPAKAIVAAALVLGMGNLGWQCYRANFVLHTHWSNPWVYAHPIGSVREIGQRVEELAALHQDKEGMWVRVLDEENLWPVPFYLRKLNHVSYLKNGLPNDAEAPVLIVSDKRADEVVARFGDRYVGPHNFGVRADVKVSMFVHKELWEKFMERQHSKSPP